MIVRNIKYAFKKDHNVYIGRGDKARGIARSPLANPFWIRNQNDDEERKESIKQYRVWLWKKMQADDEAVWTALRKITAHSVLLCHCYPKACHGTVVRDAWTWAYKTGKIDQPRAERTPRTHYDERPILTAPAPVTVPLAPAPIAAPEPVTVNTLQRTLPPKKKQGRGAPRTPRGICYTTPDVRYNLIDDMAADLAELYSHMSPGMIDYLALTPDEQATRDAAFDTAEIAYEASQLAMAAA